VSPGPGPQGTLDATEQLHLVVPETVDDPSQPSGGNVYDLELARALQSLGCGVRVHRVGTCWAEPSDPPADELDERLAALPDHAIALVDGLLGLGAPEVLVRSRRRLQVWLLVHLPLALTAGTPAVRAREHRALAAAAGAIVTSGWTRDWLLATYDLDPDRVHVARPGVHPATPSVPSRAAGALLCVGAVGPDKGQDVLLDALTTLGDLAWSCRLVGPVDRDPAFVDRLQRQVDAHGLSGRVSFTGPLPRAAVEAALQDADLLVVPSRLETYGMVATEGLAHGLPVVAARTGGLVEALGVTADGRVPGLLVPPGDSRALAESLRRWLEDATWRSQLRAAVSLRRAQLSDWSRTAQDVRGALRAAPLNRGADPHVVRAWP
jgi:glycosyltransferase involved in cell wall biosynthesis